MKRKILLIAAVAINSAALVSVEAYAAPVGFNIEIGNAPPPVRYEAVPRARRGYAWAPGYWNWNGHRHVWVRGHWEREHAGQRYYAPEWKQTDKGWRLNPGGWRVGDSDHDGVPNRVDHDRDGDGVSNRNDNHPDNPHRQ